MMTRRSEAMITHRALQAGSKLNLGFRTPLAAKLTPTSSQWQTRGRITAEEGDEVIEQDGEELEQAFTSGTPCAEITSRTPCGFTDDL